MPVISGHAQILGISENSSLAHQRSQHYLDCALLSCSNTPVRRLLVPDCLFCDSRPHNQINYEERIICKYFSSSITRGGSINRHRHRHRDYWNNRHQLDI